MRTCSVTFHGNMYVLGESISLVKGCRLFNTGFRSFTLIRHDFHYNEKPKERPMPTEFDSGICISYTERREENLIVCSAVPGDETCYKLVF